MLENIVRKGEIAGLQHFLSFPQCLKSFLSWCCGNKVLFGTSLTLSPGFYVKGKYCGKRRNFSFSHYVFHPFWRTFFHLYPIQNCLLQTLWYWKSLNFVVLERVKRH